MNLDVFVAVVCLGEFVRLFAHLLDARLDHEVCLVFHVELYCELETFGGGGVDIFMRLCQPEMLPHELVQLMDNSWS